MGKNFNREQNTVCLLLFVSFVAGIICIYFNRVGGIRVGSYAISTAICLVPLTFLYLKKVHDVLNAVLLASLGGLTFGAGVGLTGVWYVSENPSRMWLGPKWLLIGGILIAAFVYSVKSLQKDPPSDDLLATDEAKELSRLDQLKAIEKVLDDDSPYQPVKKALLNPAGLASFGIGLVMMVPVIVSTESRMSRLIMIIILIGTIAFCVLIVSYLRERTFARVNANIVDIDSSRMLALAEIRAEIAKIEASTGDEPSSPNESA